MRVPVAGRSVAVRIWTVGLFAISCVAITTCSRPSPTAPSSSAGAPVGRGGVPIVSASTRIHPEDGFPPRDQPLDFRRQLETYYQTALRRGLTATFVDLEGDIVWTQEYLRYRVSSCDHTTAVQKVMAQIGNGVVQPVCGPTTNVFPPRNEPLDFRRQLEGYYQLTLRRGSTGTYVDLEGDIVWTQEYLRYRVSGCDHTTATQKVFTQISGGGIQPDCTNQCAYGVSASNQSFGSSGGSATLAITRLSGTCGWSAGADVSWISLGARSGGGSSSFTFSVQSNGSTADRSGTITVQWSGGATQMGVFQSGATPQSAFLQFVPGSNACQCLVGTATIQIDGLNRGSMTCTTSSPVISVSPSPHSFSVCACQCTSGTTSSLAPNSTTVYSISCNNSVPFVVRPPKD